MGLRLVRGHCRLQIRPRVDFRILEPAPTKQKSTLRESSLRDVSYTVEQLADFADLCLKKDISENNNTF